MVSKIIKSEIPSIPKYRGMFILPNHGKTSVNWYLVSRLSKKTQRPNESRKVNKLVKVPISRTSASVRTLNTAIDPKIGNAIKLRSIRVSRWVLNPQPLDPQSSALPVELRPPK